MPHPVIEASQRFRQQLIKRNAQAERRMVQAYGRAYERLQPQISALEEAAAGLTGPTRGQVSRLSSMRILRAQIEDEINRYAVVADQEIVNLTGDAIRLGLQGSRATVEAYFDPAFLRERGLMRAAQGSQQALRASWTQLAPEQVQTMVGFLSEDSPLHSNLVDRLGSVMATRMADKLTDAIALGINPRQIAREARDELGVGLQWSMTTARTAQLWAYREATRANYMANSDILDGWIWTSALDDRTCMSCISKHGERFSLDVVLADHHNGRCVAIPTGGLMRQMGIAPEMEPGETWFNAQPESTQRAMMGPGMFDAWKAGEFAFSDLSQPYSDPVYGEMFREASLKGLLGSKAKQYYRNGFHVGQMVQPRRSQGTGAAFRGQITRVERSGVYVRPASARRGSLADNEFFIPRNEVERVNT